TLPKRGYRLLIEPVPLHPVTRSAPTESEELCRRGRLALSVQPNADSLKQARLYFERSTQLDSENAGALSGLAQTYIRMVALGLGRGGECLRRARAAALGAGE